MHPAKELLSLDRVPLRRTIPCAVTQEVAEAEIAEHLLQR